MVVKHEFAELLHRSQLDQVGRYKWGVRGPTTALVTGPVIWAKAIEQTIAIPRITPEITKSFDLASRIVFNPLSANRDFPQRIAVHQKHVTRLVLARIRAAWNRNYR